MLTPSSLHPEDGGSKVFRNVGILPRRYTASQPKRLRHETLPPWKPLVGSQRKYCPMYVSENWHNIGENEAIFIMSLLNHKQRHPTGMST